MDLARLVLARQSAARLVSLPRLIVSERFLKTWREVNKLPIPRARGIPFIKEAAANGDLCPESQIYYLLHHLINRSAFLCSPQMFGYFSEISVENFDFWYAISTGIPEIQTHALLNLENAQPNFRAIAVGSLNDPTTIPWTPKLEAHILLILNDLADSPLVHYSLLDSAVAPIYGALLRPIPHFRNRTDNLREFIYAKYLKFFILRALNGTETTERVEIIEKAIERRPPTLYGEELDSVLVQAGYLLYVKIPSDPAEQQNLAMAAAFYISYNVLRWLSNSGASIVNVYDIRDAIQKASHVITWKMVMGARACLDDPGVRGLMSKDVINLYKALALESGVTSEAIPIIKLTGTPVSERVMTEEERTSYQNFVSIQGSKMINAAYAAMLKRDSSNRNSQLETVAWEIAFIRGQVINIRPFIERPVPEVVNAITRKFIHKADTAGIKIPEYPRTEDIPVVMEVRNWDPATIQVARDKVGLRGARYQQILVELKS